jgi:hypothetical protein
MVPLLLDIYLLQVLKPLEENLATIIKNEYLEQFLHSVVSGVCAHQLWSAHSTYLLLIGTQEHDSLWKRFNPTNGFSI